MVLICTPGKILSAGLRTGQSKQNPEVKSLVAGSAEGILYGGCLSILVASLGTPYEIQTEGTILFLEDIAAKPFQIDRMLMQLKLAGKLKGVRGIIFGEMLDCVQNAAQIKGTRWKRLFSVWSVIQVSGCLRITLRPCFAAKYHTSFRRARRLERWQERSKT